MAYDDFDPEQFKKKNPVEDAFGIAAMQGRMLSSSPAVVAASLGIPADRVEGMDPQSIMRMGRAAARNISAAQQDAIQTQDGKAFNTKEYLANQVGPPDQDPTQLQKQLTAEAGPTQQDQQKHFKSMLDDLRRKVATGDVRGTNIPKSVIDILTFTKKMDAFWAGKVSDATPAALAAGGGPGGNGATAPLPQTGIGPYEKVALSFLFDSDTKILPDYTSMHDAQSMGMAPGTDLGGSAAPGSTGGVSRGVDKMGNPLIGNVGPGSGAPGEDIPTVGASAQTPGITMGGGQPTNQYRGMVPPGQVNPNYQPSQMGMNVPPGSPSQERMLQGQPLVQPEAPAPYAGDQAIPLGPSPAAPPAPQMTGEATVPQGGPTQPMNYQQKPDPVQFALAYRSKHPTSTPAEARQVYNSLYGP